LVVVGGGGGGDPPVTVMVALPTLPWLVALISEEPAATPVTRPAPETVATLVLLDDQLTERWIWLPRRSCSVAVACVVWPTEIVQKRHSRATNCGSGDAFGNATPEASHPMFCALASALSAAP